MNLKKKIGIFCLIVGSVMAPMAGAVDSLTPKDFAFIQPVQKTDNVGKIEVVEFFSYACPHCKDANPMVLAWAAKLPKDVVFKRVPVSFNRTYMNLAKLFFALETTGDLQRLDEDVFNAVHVQNVALMDEGIAAEWLDKRVVDKKKFVDAYRSSAVENKVKAAQAMSSAYGVEGVPSFAVNGRYRVLTERVETLRDFVTLTGLLVDKVRAEGRRP